MLVLSYVHSGSSDLVAFEYALDFTDCSPLPPYVREQVPVCSLSETSFWLCKHGVPKGINCGHFCIGCEISCLTLREFEYLV